MCGIAGFYSSDTSFSEDVLLKMNFSLRHRGPDADGIFIDQNIGLAHKRLSILDLSSSANQPFFSASGKYVIVYNGEVYNFKELARELGMHLKTKSDTEVIIELFEKSGVSFVHKLNGMFTIVIYDRTKKELYLFRDRLGIKPLYYYWYNNNFVFASELKSLITVDEVRKNISLNSSAITSFLHLGYIPSPSTIYNHVSKAPSGSYLIINDKGLKIEKYWSVESKIGLINNHSLADAKEELKGLFESSIEYCLVSDVPVGILLSGGIDSSLIATIAQKKFSSPINTFTISYYDKAYDESKYARDVAISIGSRHTEYCLTSEDAKDHLEAIIDNFDEPYADSSALPTFIVSKMAKKEVKVLVSGEGGDELFMGYGTYNWAKRLTSPGVYPLKEVISGLIDRFGGKYKNRSNMFKYNDVSDIHSHIFSQEQNYFLKSEIKSLLSPQYYQNFKLGEDFEGIQRNLTSRERQALFDIKYYLQDDLLAKLDMCSMLNSMEARVPFLDHRIAEFALNLPEKFKVKNGKDKFILREILKDYLPEGYFERPKKGFSMPLDKWMQTDLKYLANKYLSEEEIKRTKVLNYKYVAQLKNDFFNNHSYLYVRLWTLIVLQKFLQKHPV